MNNKLKRIKFFTEGLSLQYLIFGIEENEIPLYLQNAKMMVLYFKSSVYQGTTQEQSWDILKGAFLGQQEESLTKNLLKELKRIS